MCRGGDNSMSITTRYERITLDNGAVIEFPVQEGLPIQEPQERIEDRLQRLENLLTLLINRVP